MPQTVLAIIFHGKGRKYLLYGMLIFAHYTAYSQSCNCPAADECAACQGGLVSLTFRYNGTSASYIVAEDDEEVLFSGWVAPGETFTVVGSESDGHFEDNELELDGTGIPDVEIRTSCGSGVYVNATYGSFTVISGESKIGGQICCDADDDGSEDLTPPVISNCPSNIQVSLDATGCSKTVNWTEPTATDICGVPILASSHDPGDNFESGTTLVTYTATDEQGNTSNCTFNVIVVDNINPVITGCPSDIIVTANASCKATVSWNAPTTTDNCALASFTSTPISGSLFNVGTTKVTYTATDVSGKTSTCSFNVIVNDNINPVITGCPSNVTVSANASCEAIVSWTEPLAEDNCSIASFKSSHDSGAIFPIGTTTVKYTATDVNGNISVCQFNVVVKDNAPIISDCPNDITIMGDESGVANIDWVAPTATSFCDKVTLTSSHQPGGLFQAGTTAVEYKAADNSGNASYCTFNVTVSWPEIDIDVSKVITPDGNKVNDSWIISNIERFHDNRVTVVDRWGGVLFSASGYNNENVIWTGTNRNGVAAPTGTYFYTISVRMGPRMLESSGFIELIR